ncbi:MAG: hypothetical protein HY924_03190 [Elusimicrobia bacterium]|nr:hypothetical protein [Elusimicrobiota bacterium]
MMMISALGQAAPAKPKAWVETDTRPVLQANEECRAGGTDFRKHYAAAVSQPGTSVLAVMAASSSTVEAMRSVEKNLACMGIAGDPRWSCASIKSAKTSNCSELEGFGEYARAVFHGNADAAACSRYLPRLIPNLTLPPAEQRRICGLLAQAVEKGDSGALCAAVMGKSVVGSPAAQPCAEQMRHLEGNSARCATVKDEAVRSFCSVKADLVAALRSKDPRLCAASPLCAVLTHRHASACEPFLQAANRQFCEHVARIAAPIEARKKEDAAKASKTKAMFEEAAKREKERVAEFHKKRLEEERIFKEKIVATEYRMAQEAAAAKRAESEKRVKSREEAARKKQFRSGQRMQPMPLDALKEMEAVKQGKEGPQTRKIPFEGKTDQ